MISFAKTGIPFVVIQLIILSICHVNFIQASDCRQCHPDSTCYTASEGKFCLCPPTRTGKFCETHTGPCSRNPCQHGNCSETDMKFRCLCHTGYTGTLCQTQIYSPRDSALIPNGNISLAMGKSMIVTANDAAITSYVNSSYWTTANGAFITKCRKDRHNRIIYPDTGMCSYTLLFEDGSKLNKLYLASLTYEDTGNYFYNAAISIYKNTVFQHEFYIEVNGPPINMSVIPNAIGQKHLLVNATDNLTLICAAGGKPTPILMWKCINEAGQILSHSGNMTFNSVSLRNTGVCYCTATNVYGTLKKNISIVIVDKPEPATNVDINDITNTSFRIQFKPGYAGRSTHLYYQIHYATIDSQQCFIDKKLNYTRSRRCTTSNCTLNNMLPGSHLVVWVRTVTNYGISHDSQPTCVMLKDKPKNPTSVILASEGKDVLVMWEQLESEPEISYNIRYRTVADTEWIDVPVDIVKKQYLIQHLTTDTVYLFRLQAINIYGESDSPINSIHIKGAPSRPQIKEISSMLREFNLTWYPISYNGGYNINDVTYSVEYIHSLPYIPITLPSSLNCALCQRINDIGDTNATIHHLHPNALYYYRIVARNRFGYNQSEWYKERTKNLPSPPEDIQLTISNDNDAIISWSASQSSDKILHYNVSFKPYDDLRYESKIVTHDNYVILYMLEKFILYQFYIVAIDTFGASKETPIQYFILDLNQTIPQISPVNSTQSSINLPIRVPVGLAVAVACGALLLIIAVLYACYTRHHSHEVKISEPQPVPDNLFESKEMKIMDMFMLKEFSNNDQGEKSNSQISQNSIDIDSDETSTNSTITPEIPRRPSKFTNQHNETDVAATSDGQNDNRHSTLRFKYDLNDFAD